MDHWDNDETVLLPGGNSRAPGSCLSFGNVLQASPTGFRDAANWYRRVCPGSVSLRGALLLSDPPNWTHEELHRDRLKRLLAPLNHYQIEPGRGTHACVVYRQLDRRVRG